MSATSFNAKGNALESAVEMIERAIIQEKLKLADDSVRIFPKKIIRKFGVRHEIDLWVEINHSEGYESLFVFECKNWKRKVGKNEVIIFKEKVEASGAQRGFIVAERYTSDAVHQAKQSSRIKLLTARELGISEIPIEISSLHGVHDLNARFQVRIELYGQSSPYTGELLKKQFELNGHEVEMEIFIRMWCGVVLKQRIHEFNSAGLEAGAYPFPLHGLMKFDPGKSRLDGMPVRAVEFDGTVDLIVERGSLTSKYEVTGRGRAYSWEVKFPDETYQLDISQTESMRDEIASQKFGTSIIRVVKTGIFENEDKFFPKET